MTGTKEMPGLYLRVDAYLYCTSFPKMCRSLAAQPVVLGADGLNLKQAVGSTSSKRAANNSPFFVIVPVGTLHIFPYCAENRYIVHVALSILVGC